MSFSGECDAPKDGWPSSTASSNQRAALITWSSQIAGLLSRLRAPARNQRPLQDQRERRAAEFTAVLQVTVIRDGLLIFL